MFIKIGQLLLAGLVTVSAHAGVISLVTSSGALGANDSVTWNQLGIEGTTVTHNFTATSASALAIAGSFAGTTGQVATVGSAWGPASGPFANNDFLIWALDPAGVGTGTGPITLGGLGSAFGVGAGIQADALGAFTAKLEVFNGAASLGFFTVNSNVAGDALFIGVLDTNAEITKAVFSLTASGNGGNVANPAGDFAIDTLGIQSAVTGAPEPGSIFLLGSALAAVAFKLRRRS